MKKANTTPNKIKAKLGLQGVSDTDAAKTFMTAYHGLLNNPKYSNPPVDLAIYKAGIDQFSALIVHVMCPLPLCGRQAVCCRSKQHASAYRPHNDYKD